MKYHLIGDKGISMRGIKKILEENGHIVTGSDLKGTKHSKENITKDIDVIVRTSAVTPKSPGWLEVKEAMRLGIPIKKRSEIIGEITKDKFLITVSGMHGKTTVTSLIGIAMEKAGLDPTVLVGEEVREFSGVVRLGKSKYFVLEACEYDKSFYDFYPNIAVILNLDLEHLDTFPHGWPDIEDTFIKFFNNIKKDGSLIYFGNDKRLRKIVGEKAPKNIHKIDYYNQKKLKLNTRLFGEHNSYNIQAAVAVMDVLGIKTDKYISSFENFKGAKRRLEYRGEYKGAKIYDDYGHHPTEIKTTMEALSQKYPTKKLCTVFWPHQYKRVDPLLKDFADVLSLSQKVVLKPIYFVPGRDEIREVSSKKLAGLIEKNGIEAKVYASDRQIVRHLNNFLNDEWIVLTIGIPPVYKVADLLVTN